jgi:hypothetical protein
MTATRQQLNVKNGQPTLDFTRPFMDDKRHAISGVDPEHVVPPMS